MANHAVFQLTAKAVDDGFAGALVRVSDFAEINLAEALHAGGGVITIDLDTRDGGEALTALEAHPALERVFAEHELPVEVEPQAPQALVVVAPPAEATEAAARERQLQANIAVMEEAREEAEFVAELDAEAASESTNEPSGDADGSGAPTGEEVN